MLVIPQVIGHAGPLEFIDPANALSEPNGLLAMGGDLSAERLLLAYRNGIFPWFNEDQPILWWSPDPRLVLYPKKLKISRSLRKTLRKNPFRVTVNESFGRVMQYCASSPRPGQDGTWINHEMLTAYIRLHQMGFAHSVECWQDGELVGGLYGINLGRVFFGESMFSHRSDASKVAFSVFVDYLLLQGIELIDCQVSTSHLMSLGAQEIPRDEFIARLKELIPPENSSILNKTPIVLQNRYA